MAIELFPHNENAYLAALSMLRETGKAAVIHPTGTGKSFIGFKLCEDHPDKRICWLSPSEYIFRTQLENLAAVGADKPENITFFTYARLMMMNDKELAAIRPDYIIQDEFHRIGAEKWGAGVQRLLKLYPDAKLLGLSATNIRYLDNQRDMAGELFDGNVASEMTLGEAIVRGILNAPKYVLSVFACQEDYGRLRSRVRRAKSRAVRDEAEKYLEALRRALEHADGLDVIFDKHMTDRHGKYLVFCANVEHMREMMGHVPEWFGKIDAKPHVYSAYSDDPAASRAFRDFKADGSGHLKLLFCIDMLNEGIHVEDVSGVILFRPTVSPIIYKQQIGRALSASRTKDPIIFDVVNNIENLCSIGTVEQEIQAAVSYYRFYGDGKEIINERFQLIDELRDARELFERLNDTLAASWDLMYEYARQYYELHGDLNVPQKYKTDGGYSLGTWLQTQRKVYAGERYGNLSADRVEKLNAIGMRWGSYLDQSWERHYQAAKDYYEAHGDLKVAATETTDSGLRLGAWIASLRTYKKNGIRCAYLSSERIAALEEIGMVWDVFDYLWEENFAAAMRYYREYGDLDIPISYVAPNGLRVGAWIQKLKGLRRGSWTGAELTQEQITRLDSIGMIWESKQERAWNRGYTEAKAYYAQHGDLNVPITYVSPTGYTLGHWISNRRVKGREKHTKEQREQLDAMGMVWKRPDSWEARYALAKAYFEEHGDLKIPSRYKAGGIWLSKWLNEQRQIYIGNRPGKTLTREQISRLEAIGMEWENRKRIAEEMAWQEQFEEARQYFQNNGDLKIPGDFRTTDGKNLSIWVQKQRSLWKEGKLSPEQIKLLTAIGMEWEFDDPWEIGFEHAERYFKDRGNLDIEGSYICEDGYRLGCWLVRQRANHNNPKQYHALTAEQSKRLEAIGIVWRPKDARWMEGFDHAKAYLAALNGDAWQQRYVSPDGFKTGEWIRNQIRVFQGGGGEGWKKAKLVEIGIDVNGERQTPHTDRRRKARTGAVVHEAV